MGARTWPAPSEDEVWIARHGIELQATAHGLDLDDAGVKAFINNGVGVKAETMAQIRWMQKIIDTQLAENAELKKSLEAQ